MDTKLEVKNYLSQGVPQEAVARALGIDPSYVSQLMAEEEFATEVQEARMVAAARDSGVDHKIRQGEEAALDRVLAKLPMAGMKDALLVFKVLNAAKLRKDSMIPQAVQSTGTVVEIYLPGAMVPQYVQNKKSEIIEVNGKTMVSAGVKQLERMHLQKVGPTTSDERALEMMQLIGGPADLETQRARPVRKDLQELLAQL